MKIWLETSTLKEIHISKLNALFPKHEFILDYNDASDAEIAITMPQYAKKEILDRMPSLKMVKLLTAGYNTLNLDYFKQRGLLLAYAKDVFSIQIAEDVIAKILYINRRLADYQAEMDKHQWSFKPITYELYGSIVGIVGAGSIGTEVAKRLKAFGCYTIGYRRSMIHESVYDEMVHDDQGLQSLYKRSDYIIVTIPLTKDTKHFIGRDAFSSMKKTALVINVARGEVIDQDALIDALNHEIIRGAGLDVTTPEPLPESNPLWVAKHIFITPHQASASPMMHERLLGEVIDTLNRYFSNQELQNLVKL